MRLVIIADDKSVGIGGVFLAELDLSPLDPAIHAVQWYDTYGEVEYKTQLQDGRLVKPENAVITDVAPYQFAVDAWNAESAALAAAEAAHQMPVTEL
jgi:hypothetical protein